jgi:hypothetical protein
MNEVKPINKERIRHILDKLHFQHMVDEDGDFMGKMSADKDVPYDVIWWVILDKKLVLKLLAESLKEVPVGRSGESLVFCNTWNRDHFLPQVFFHEERNTIMARISVDLEKGIHDELLEDIIRQVSFLWQFYKEAAKNGL